MTDLTPRLSLPMLHAGQAQKEITHNEALFALDVLLHSEVEGVGQNEPPVAPADGQCWIVGSAPVGAWEGQADRIAAWSESGWRFLRSCEGMLLWSRHDAQPIRRISGSWRLGELRGSVVTLGGMQVLGPQQPAIAFPEGGNVVDAEARTTLAVLLNTLQQHGLVARNAE
ncbi:DUF2793 domain-containing protein [Sphingomonas sp. PL-96]|uniref:DUF2793 domain-containing protein n=1 Tax=Sphingomonas sp. PL-96 TaxID=2887201 RepID=UPI001E506340|nr:DUF2793 domain-containing protein [Sphingomonas sp. PL-96]MCC2977401.1 DUF2793 domain-containing protein [Sphingomonas sp. PL-96]